MKQAYLISFKRLFLLYPQILKIIIDTNIGCILFIHQKILLLLLLLLLFYSFIMHKITYSLYALYMFVVKKTHGDIPIKDPQALKNTC